MALESGRQYRSDELTPNLINITNGDTVTMDGQKYKGIVNNNGTRSFESLGAATPRLDFVKGLTDQALASDQTYATKQNDARNSLIGYYSGLEKPTDTYSRLSDENGLKEQQALVDSLTKDVMTQQDTLDNVDPNVTQRAGNFLVNESDRQAIVAREQKPIIDNLNKLLRNKQYEEVGLAGKQQLVATLLQLTQADNEQGAKPLQLGVDYTTDDRNAARELFSSIMGAQVGAFSGDQSAAESAAEAEKTRQFQAEQQQLSFGQQTDLANLTSKNSLSNDLALKAYDTAHKTGSTASNGAPNDNSIYTGKTKAQVQQITNNTDNAWNKILAGAKTEYDVWKAINSNQGALSKANVDVQDLWSKHAALAAKTGQGGTIRAKDNSVY